MNGFVEKGSRKMINRETIFRTVSFSELLTRFFKYDINKLLNDEDYNVEIIYFGGDDVFLIGYWTDVIKTAQCIHDAFKKYTLGRLTISGGIGLIPPKISNLQCFK
jgi:CRISPR-associated protein Csm1